MAKVGEGGGRKEGMEGKEEGREERGKVGGEGRIIEKQGEPLKFLTFLS